MVSMMVTGPATTACESTAHLAATERVDGPERLNEMKSFRGAAQRHRPERSWDFPIVQNRLKP